MREIDPLLALLGILALAGLVVLFWRARESLLDLDQQGLPRNRPRDLSARQGPRNRLRDWVEGTPGRWPEDLGHGEREPRRRRDER